MADAIDDYFADGQNTDSDQSDNDDQIKSDDESFVDADLAKIENDVFDDEVEQYDSDGLLDATLFPSFGGKLQPKFVKFDGNCFPPYPKTHPEGIAHVIELPPEILSDEKKVNQFRTALQYSMTKGHGIKTRNNVEFFSIDGEDVPMNYFYRQCNGMKALNLKIENANLCRCKSL
jgi:hypothetical protein